MIVKYKIEVPNEFSAEFWEVLTENFNIILTKKQHSIDGETLCIDVTVTDTKIKQNIELRAVIAAVLNCYYQPLSICLS